ncbi:MAG: leucyl aminopeptidase family protein [Aestuariivirga sp.]|uniref:leucyl aminopeptidase family protein n=1 Tax=Aestuariivirga sp. TaxID=2650926 RepID=UPI0025BF7231|nr:leucyl aminopeptidase family protein [Aestuariivirga sp.]MCA3561955.1 leucyl aminopeptidase family protein [Aestuariivirga sp.]
MTEPAEILLASTLRGIPVDVIAAVDWATKRRDLRAEFRDWADANDFKAQAGRFLVMPGPKGQVKQVLVGADASDAFALGKLCRGLPPGAYAIRGAVTNLELMALGWCLESYGFGRYGKTFPPVAQLVCPKGVDREAVLRAARASFMVRDLVNTPASDMGPDELELAARGVARVHRAKLTVTAGKTLERNFPMIHAVGKASPRAPRLIDFAWGPARAPKVTLVGKGVCFDTGGLDIKPASGMALMKKDMGGAANVLGLAQMIMAAKLNVRLRVLIPAVENAIAGNAFRPGDVLKSRRGITVEIGNTDAEGRMVLGDALALADEEKPDLLIDMATLTGAARVALGPDLPPFYTDDDVLAAAIARAGQEVNDPVWRLPYWQPYTRLFESSVADMSNSGDSGFAGSITAALFLKRFVEKAKAYVHFDIFAWTPAPRPGRPKGGEAQAMRALFEVIRQRYA